MKKTLFFSLLVVALCSCGYQGTSTMYMNGYKYITKTKSISNPFGKSKFIQVTYRYNNKGVLVDSIVINSQGSGL